MSAKWEKKGTNDGVLTFEIKQEDIQKGLTQTFNRVKKTLSVPGFRKGKVNRQIFNKMYGEESLYEETLNALLPKAYEEAVKEAGIDPVSQPKIDISSMEKDQDWVITGEVTVKPEVKLGEYKDLKVAKQEREVTDADLDARLKTEQEAQAELVLKEGEAAVDGDTVVIDFEGFKDGVAFEGGKGENYALVLGSNSFIPGFEEQLVGVKAEDEKEITVTFPAEYQAADLAGAEAVFKIKVHEVKGKVLPELDDEFAKDVDDEVETLDELKAKYRKQLEEEKIATAVEAVKELAIEKAVENAEIVEMPHVMVHDEIHRQMDGFFNNLQRQGIAPEMYYQITGTTEADLHAQYEKDAEVQVKVNLVIEAIADAENFEATEEDINAEIDKLASTYNMSADQVRRMLTPDMLGHDIKLRKAFELVTETAQEEA